jgi:hypothetical protein
MRKLTLVLPLLWGCAENIVKEDYRKLSADERAVLITKLWTECRDAIREYGDVAAEDHRGRIRILEEAIPYGRRGFEIAPYDASDATWWYALCAFYLGYEYEAMRQQCLRQGEGQKSEISKAEAEAHRAKAVEYLTEAVKRFTHYQQHYFDSRPQDLLPPFLSLSYEVLGDTRAAYLVTLRWCKQLRSMAKQGVLDASLDRQIRWWQANVDRLKQQLIDKLQPVPEDPGANE